MSANGWSLDTGPLFDYILLRVEAIKRRKPVEKVAPPANVVSLLKSLNGPDTRRAFEELLRTRRNLYAASGVVVELTRLARDNGHWNEPFVRCLHDVFASFAQIVEEHIALQRLDQTAVLQAGLVDEQVCQLALRRGLTILTSDRDELLTRARELEVAVRFPSGLLS